ncbi:MAG: hypothetical protein V2A34_09280 [Lentisphaerota bacterium]
MDRVRCCYGIDLSDRSIVIVKSVRSRKGIVHQLLLDARGEDLKGAAGAWISSIDADVSAGRATTAAAIPVHDSFTRWLQTPLKSVSKALKVLPSLLDIQLPFPLESCIYTFPLHRKTAAGQVDALAIAAPAQNVQTRIETCRQAGLDPLTIDHEGLALWTQSLAEMPLERNIGRAVVYLGTDRTVLVLGREDQFGSAHAIRQGLSTFFPPGGPASATALQQFGQRARQILRSLPPDARTSGFQWFWTGPGAADPGQVLLLQDQLKDLDFVRFSSHQQPSAFLARALGERGLQPDSLPCNLRTGASAHPGFSRLSDQKRSRSMILLLSAGLVLCAINLGWNAWLQSALRNRQEQLSRAAAGITGMTRVPKGQELMMVRRSLADRDQAFRPFVRAFQPSVFTVLQGILRSAITHQMKLDQLSLKDDLLSLSGAAQDWDRCEALSRDLETSGFTVSLERQDAGADERVHFTINGRRAP